MDVPTFYVETSVWGSLAPRQPADRKRLVRRLLSLLDGERGICVMSGAVFFELEKAPAERTAPIYEGIERVRPVVLLVTDAVELLAREYITAGILPDRRELDALHVAAATCYGLDYLVSWNHRHMTRPIKRAQFEAVNTAKGYGKTPAICNPLEAIDDLRLDRTA